LDPDLPLFYRISIEGLCSPIKFDFIYKSEMKNLDIYLDTLNKAPTSKNCELKFSNVDQFFIFSHKIGQTNIDAAIKNIKDKVGIN
jgi:hypothetical protein